MKKCNQLQLITITPCLLCAKDCKIHLTLYDLQVVGLWWRAKEYEVHLTLYDLILNNFPLNYLEKNSQVSMLDILCNLNNKVKIKIVCFLHLTKCLNMYYKLLLIFWGNFFYLENPNFCLYQPSFSIPNLKKKALPTFGKWRVGCRKQTHFKDGLTGLLERQRFIK